MRDERETVPCQFCELPTPMLGTRMCDNCWEVHARIRSMPSLVLSKILLSGMNSIRRAVLIQLLLAWE